jgi:hypothetical protein
MEFRYMASHMQRDGLRTLSGTIVAVQEEIRVLPTPPSLMNLKQISVIELNAA